MVFLFLLKWIFTLSRATRKQNRVMVCVNRGKVWINLFRDIIIFGRILIFFYYLTKYIFQYSKLQKVSNNSIWSDVLISESDIIKALNSYHQCYSPVLAEIHPLLIIRPVSLTPLIYTVIERLIRNAIYHHQTSNKLLSNH